MTYPAGDLRDQLAHVGAAAVAAGLVVGSGGNLSAREPGSDTCWVTGTGTWLDRLGRDAFARIRIADGTVLDRPGGVAPSSEWRLHAATYRARPDV
ncbi:MAG: class II aldolase/adducin family protein, partial [Pseudonocardia sp.]